MPSGQLVLATTIDIPYLAHTERMHPFASFGDSSSEVLSYNAR